MPSLYSLIFIGMTHNEQAFLMHQSEMTERRERQKVQVCSFKRGYNSDWDCKNRVQVQSWEVFTYGRCISSKNRSVVPRPCSESEVFTNRGFTVYICRRPISDSGQSWIGLVQSWIRLGQSEIYWLWPRQIQDWTRPIHDWPDMRLAYDIYE
jgi:hypothetical protein